MNVRLLKLLNRMDHILTVSNLNSRVNDHNSSVFPMFKYNVHW